MTLQKVLKRTNLLAYDDRFRSYNTSVTVKEKEVEFQDETGRTLIFVRDELMAALKFKQPKEKK